MSETRIDALLPRNSYDAVVDVQTADAVKLGALTAGRIQPITVVERAP